jgi:ATP-binding cassette subfamily B protein RaxB
MSAIAVERGRLFDGLQFGWRSRLPVVLQTEAAECGLACLTMIARYHGHDVDLPSLRRRHSMSLKGANLARVMEMAAMLGFEARALRLELDELPQLKTPCILHWDLNHFVVLQRASARAVVVHDPARGVRKLALAEASEHFTGVALELIPKTNFRPVRARESISLKALTGKTAGLPGALAQILVMALALEAFALVGPFYLQWVMDQVLVSADRDLLTLLGIGFLLVALFQAVLTAVRAWTITWVGAMLKVQWVSNVFSHLLHLPLDWFEKRHVGDVVSRFGSLRERGRGNRQSQYRVAAPGHCLHDGQSTDFRISARGGDLDRGKACPGRCADRGHAGRLCCLRRPVRHACRRPHRQER